VIPVQALNGIALFARLNPAQRQTVAEGAREVRFDTGYRLFDEGQPAIGCWILRTGQVSLDLCVPTRARVVVQTLGPGDVLGWSWLLPPRLWRLGAVADEPVTALELDTTKLATAADDDPTLGYRLALGLIETLVTRLHHTRARLLDLYGSPGARGR
jgi:CRP-like cAMP-binding protein